MATKAATKRLGKEAQMMDKDPPPFCYGRPREDNVLEWHFILRGPPDTPYHGGEYWGQLLFPPEYPFKPPGIKMSTPSGRFHTDSKICTSMSDFHPGSWNPAWSVANILVGLLSFMCADEMTTGSVMASDADRRTLAQRSHAFNIAQPRFKRLFSDYASPAMRELPNMGDKKPVANDSATHAQATQSSNPSGANDMSTGVVKTRATSTSSTSQRRPSGRLVSPQQQQASAQPQAQPPAHAHAHAQPRSRAIFPLLVALAAYLFISRISSLFGGGTSSPSVGGSV